MPLDEILGDGQPEPGAPPAPAYQRKKKFFAQFPGHSRPGVNHIDTDDEGMTPALNRVLTLDPSAQRDRPTVGHRLAGVAHEVEKSLDDLLGVGQEPGQARVVITNQAKIRMVLASGEPGDVLDRFVDVDRLPLRREARTEETFDQARETVDFLEDHLRAGAAFRIFGVPSGEQLRGPADTREGIADLVGKRADEVARRLMPLVEGVLPADEKMAVKRGEFDQNQVFGAGRDHAVDGKHAPGDLDPVLAVSPHLPALEETPEIPGQRKKGTGDLAPASPGKAEKLLRRGIGVVNAEIVVDAQDGGGELREKRGRIRAFPIADPPHAVLVPRADGDRRRVQGRAGARGTTDARSGGCGWRRIECWWT